MLKRKSTARTRKFSVPKRLGALIVTFLFLLIPVVIYFTLYISNQTSYFTRSNFRQLASISSQVEERIDQLKGLFSNAVAQTVRDQLDSHQTSRPANSKASSTPLSSPLFIFQQQLGVRFTVIKPPQIRDSDLETVKKNLEAVKKNLDTPEVKIRIITGGETSKLVFVWDILPEKPNTLTAEASIKFEEIIRPLVGDRYLEDRRGSEHNEGFDAILIASLEQNRTKNSGSEGSEPRIVSKVIYQKGSPELDIDSLDNLPRADTSDKVIELKALSGSTSSADVRLADASYKIYLQPIELPLGTAAQNLENDQGSPPKGQVGPAGKQSHWLVCGLVEASHFRHETWAFPYTLLITFAFLTVLVALSWPFFKLFFIGPKDRLRLSDVYFIAFALLVGSAVLTFFMLFGLTYRHSENQLDDQLKNLSNDIDTRFHKEVNDVIKEIDKLQQSAEDKSDFKLNPGPLPRAPLKQEEPKVDFQLLRKYIDPDSKLPVYARVNTLSQETKKDDYPYFHTAVWMDSEGRRRLQWTINPGPVNVGFKDRDYFKRIMEGNSRDCCGKSFWLEPLNSRLTAEKAVIISKPVKVEDSNTGKTGVMVLDPALMSLMHTVIPSGFGFRIIDNSGLDPADDDPGDPGKVLFKSSESEQLKENFFQECDNNHSLQSLVFGRGSDFVDVNYKGEGHRLFVSPIKGFPNWSLIVFRNKQPLRTVYLETLTLAGFIFFLHAAILLIFFTIIYLIKINTQDRTEWIWPSQEMSAVYQKTLYANLLLGLLSVVVMLLLDPWPALLVTLISVIAFAGILILVFRFKLGWVLNNLHRTMNSLRIDKLFDRGDAYVWNVAVLLILTGVLPAITFYKVAYNEEMKLFVKHGQLTLALGLEERYTRVRREYSTERADWENNPSPFGTNKEDAEAFIKNRLEQQQQRDVYENFFFDTHLRQPEGKKEEGSDDSLLVSLDKLIPFFNETSIEMGGLTRSKAMDDSWWWQSIDGTLILHPKLPGIDHQDIQTKLQSFGAPLLSLSFRALLSLSFWVLGFLAILVGLFYLTRSVVRKIFLLDVNDTLYLSSLPEDKGAIAQNLFVVQTWAWADQNGFSQSDQFYRIDLTTETLDEGWVERIESRIKNEAHPSKVVVDHFECQISDPLVNNQKLRLIESLLAANKLVVILSAAEPAAYSFDRAAGEGVKTQSYGADRWALIISRFLKHYPVENNCAVIEKCISDLQATLDSDAAIPEERRNRILELAQFVQEECAPRACLQNIGKEIIQQPGFHEANRDHILGQIFERAALYYRKLWDDCSEGERLTLLHLAEDRLLSPNDPDIKPLLRKGLIVCAPDIRLMNETFKRWVLSQSLTGGLEFAEKQAKKASPWEAFKVPLFIGFAGVVLFLVLTQKDLYSSSWTLITGATTGIPAFFKLLSLFQGEGPAQKIYDA